MILATNGNHFGFVIIASSGNARQYSIQINQALDTLRDGLSHCMACRNYKLTERLGKSSTFSTPSIQLVCSRSLSLLLIKAPSMSHPICEYSLHLD